MSCYALTLAKLKTRPTSSVATILPSWVRIASPKTRNRIASPNARETSQSFPKSLTIFTTASMDKLPVEILCEVLEHLPLRAKVLLRRTSTIFNAILLGQIYKKLRRIQKLCGRRLPLAHVYPADILAAFENLVSNLGLSENHAPFHDRCIIPFGYRNRSEPMPADFSLLGTTPMSCFMHLCIFEMYREERRLHMCSIPESPECFVAFQVMPKKSFLLSSTRLDEKTCCRCKTEYYKPPHSLVCPNGDRKLNPAYSMSRWWATLENEFGEYKAGRYTIENFPCMLRPIIRYKHKRAL